MKTQTLSSVSVITLQFPSFGNPNAEREIEIAFDFDAGTVTWRNRVFQVNQRLISVRKVYSDKAFGNSDYEYLTSVISVEETMKLIMKTVNSFKQANQAINFLNELVGTVLRSDWEIDELDTTSYNLSAIQPKTDNTRDAQQVLRDYDVVGFEIKSNSLMGKGLWVEGCLATATKEWGFALPDKTNKKRAKVGDAVVVSGRSVDGTKSIVRADKPEKQLNRETMLKHIAAELPVVHEDALVAELSDGKFGVSYGLGANSLLLNDPLLSLAVGDAGIVNREPINFTANKLLRGGLNLEMLFTTNPDYHREVVRKTKTILGNENRPAQIELVLKDLRQFLKAHCTTGAETVLQPGATIKFKGQVVVENFNTFPVRLHQVKTVREGAFLNTECRSLLVEVHAKADFEDYNTKLRGQWIKGMTTRNDDYVVSLAGETINTRFILNHNSVKNEKAVSLRGWANARGQRIAFSQNGELRYVDYTAEGKWVLGDTVDLEVVEAELAEMTKGFEVRQVVSARDLAEFKQANAQAFEHVTETVLDHGLVRLNYQATGFIAPLIFAVELSSVPENLSVNRRLAANASSYLTTFVPKANDEVRRHAEKLAKSLSFASKDSIGVHFDLKVEWQRNTLANLLKDLVKLSTRDLFKQLGDKYPTIKISGVGTGRQGWEVVIPVRLMSGLTYFGKAGFSGDNKVVGVHAFLTLLATKTTCPELIAEYAFYLGVALKEWKQDVNSREQAFVKGSPLFTTHGMKVLANSMAGYELVNDREVPVIWINSNNPLVVGTVDKTGRAVKKLNDGDVVMFYRNPVVDLTPGIIRLNDKACGNYTCAVAASVLAWSSQTDNDGDTLWIVPMKQVRVDNIDVAGEGGDKVRATVAKLMAHPLVGRDIANKAMKAFGADDLFAGIIKPRDNFGIGVRDVVAKSNPDIIALAEAVANHYTIRVGQGYSMMFNAFNSFVNKFHKKGFAGVAQAELIAIKACSFVFYEEFGLSGFSANNEEEFSKITTAALTRLRKAKVISSGLFNSDCAGKDAWFYASVFRAQSILLSKTEMDTLGVTEDSLNFTDHEVGQIRREALNNGLFRTLTKGHLNQNDEVSGIFKALSAEFIEVAHPFARAMTAWQSFVNSGLLV